MIILYKAEETEAKELALLRRNMKYNSLLRNVVGNQQTRRSNYRNDFYFRFQLAPLGFRNNCEIPNQTPRIFPKIS